MTFFESLLALLAVAILLLQVSRRVGVPYPTMLAAAGVILALLPNAPRIRLDPHVALALFISPVLVDAAFDFPLAAIRRLWLPLLSLAVIAVFLSAGAVTWLGVTMAGLPLYAALALGAIVAPPDAAAATAILSSVRMPRTSVTVLKGESLLNDASALLLFTFATTFNHAGGLDAATGLRLAIAAPGGILLGVLTALLMRRINPFLTGTLGGNLAEFVACFGLWIVADRLQLSAVLCVVAFAMALARTAGLTTPPRSRIQSFAAWDVAVFLLNVLAFLLMGFQTRAILAEMGLARLREALVFALAVAGCLIVVRLAWVMLYGAASRANLLGRSGRAPTVRQGILVGWSGMRGLVTLAAAFSLPGDFPRRDLIVLTAFVVVMTTLVVQGLTLAPLVRWLKLDGGDGEDAELAAARVDLASAGLRTLEGKTGFGADHWRSILSVQCAASLTDGDRAGLDAKRQVGREVLRRQRERLEELKRQDRVDGDAFLVLQEELDFQEVTLITEDERKIAEN